MTGGRGLQAVLEAVREEIDPSPEDRRHLQDVVDELIERTEDSLAAHDVEAAVSHVGSTARSTWVRDDRDIDIFVEFPPSLDRESLQEIGIQVGMDVLPQARDAYAEHPYVRGVYDGFAVDLVPCYDVEDPSSIQSAVDRTPFHNEYLAERIDADIAADVRILKQFFRGIGVYGSDLKTAGYSGYLTELLVLEYGSFAGVLEAASGWQPPIELDPESHGVETFEDPLIVIDPTDPHRNVAAVVSEQNVATLVHHARQFLAEPTESRFFSETPAPLSPAEIRAFVEDRASTPVAVRFDPPDLVDDQLYPQLERSRSGLVRGLENRDFDVLRGEVWARDTAVLFVDLEISSLPTVERHEGPPVYVESHAERFLETYEEAAVFGPFIDDDRYVVEREREFTNAVDFVEKRLSTIALGAQLERAIVENSTILAGKEVAELAGEFGSELASFFQPRP